MAKVVEKMEAEMIDSLDSRLEDISTRIQEIRQTTFAGAWGQTGCGEAD